MVIHVRRECVLVQDVLGVQLKLPKRAQLLVIVQVPGATVLGARLFLSHLVSLQHLLDRVHGQPVPVLLKHEPAQPLGPVPGLFPLESDELLQMAVYPPRAVPGSAGVVLQGPVSCPSHREP